MLQCLIEHRPRSSTRQPSPHLLQQDWYLCSFREQVWRSERVPAEVRCWLEQSDANRPGRWKRMCATKCRDYGMQGIGARHCVSPSSGPTSPNSLIVLSAFRLCDCDDRSGAASGLQDRADGRCGLFLVATASQASLAPVEQPCTEKQRVALL